MKINSPCYKCISYAICVNRDYVICDVLFEHMNDNGINGRIATLALMKCIAVRIYHFTDKVEFINDRKEVWKHLKRRMMDYKPNYLRLVVVLGFYYYRVRIWYVMAKIPVIEKVEYVRDLLKGRHIWD